MNTHFLNYPLITNPLYYRWGKKFGLVSVPGRVVGDVLNIMAKKGTPTNVDIYYNGEKRSISLPLNGRLNTYVNVPSSKRLYIESDQPLSVTQLTKSKDTYLYQVGWCMQVVSVCLEWPYELN